MISMYFTVVLLGVVASRRLAPSVPQCLVRCRALILDIDS
jgi:hypothetical protein